MNFPISGLTFAPTAARTYAAAAQNQGGKQVETEAFQDTQASASATKSKEQKESQKIYKCVLEINQQLDFQNKAIKKNPFNPLIKSDTEIKDQLKLIQTYTNTPKSSNSDIVYVDRSYRNNAIRGYLKQLENIRKKIDRCPSQDSESMKTLKDKERKCVNELKDAVYATCFTSIQSTENPKDSQLESPISYFNFQAPNFRAKL